MMIPGWLKVEIWKLRWRIGLETVLLCLLACVPVVSAKLLQYAIDDVMLMRNAGNLRQLFVMCSTFVGVVLALKYVVTWVSVVTRQEFDLNVRTYLWGRWLDGCEGGHYTSGDMANRLLGDVHSTGEVIITAISASFVCLGSLAVFLTMLFRCNVVLAWVAVSFIPGYLILYIAFGKRIQSSTYVMRSSLDRLMAFIVFRWDWLDEIHALRGTPVEQEKFQVIAKEQYRTGLHMSFVTNLSSSVAEVITVGWNLMLFLIGVYLVLRETITLGELIAVQTIAAQIVGPVQRILGLNLSVKAAQSSIARISEINAHCRMMTSREGMPKRTSPSHVPLDGCELELVDVVCHSNTTDVKNASINLRIPIGGRVYLEGENGAGKSSISRILAGLRMPVSGMMRWNGVAISHDDLQQVRSHVFLLTHTPFFFAGTIRENLLYGLTELVDDAMLKMLLARVGLDEWLDSLPNGFEFMIERCGSNLSNGQKQRLHCVRALLRPHNVVIMDEALTGVHESDSERILTELGRGRCLVVTRLGSTANIVVEVER